MLSEEEKKAIERLNEILKEWQEIVNIEDKTEREIEMSLYMEDMPFEEIKTVLNLITKLQKENETTTKLNANMSKRHLNDIFKIKNYEKQIHLMAEYIDGDDTSLSNYLYRKNGKCNKKMIKQYFKKLAEQNSSIN